MSPLISTEGREGIRSVKYVGVCYVLLGQSMVVCVCGLSEFGTLQFRQKLFLFSGMAVLIYCFRH